MVTSGYRKKEEKPSLVSGFMEHIKSNDNHETGRDRKHSINAKQLQSSGSQVRMACSHLKKSYKKTHNKMLYYSRLSGIVGDILPAHMRLLFPSLNSEQTKNQRVIRQVEIRIVT